jgi:O-antigen ligase
MQFANTQEGKERLVTLTGLAGAVVLGLALPRYGPAVFGVILLPPLVLLMMAKPIVGLLLLAATIPMENVAIFGAGVTGTRLVGIAVFGLWFLRRLTQGRLWSPAFNTGHFYAALGVFGFALASALWCAHAGETLLGVTSLAQMIALSVLVIDLIETWEDAERLAGVLVCAGLAAALLTLEQYFVGGARRAGDDISGGVNGTAATLVTILPFAFALLRGSKNTMWRVLSGVYAGLAILAIGVTFSRSGYLALGLLLALQCWQALKTRAARGWILAGALAVAVALTYAPSDLIKLRMQSIGPALGGMLGTAMGRAEQIDSRGFHWAVGLAMFKDHPLLGVGYENYGREFFKYQFRLPAAERYFIGRRSPHSSYIGFLANQGLIGLLTWLVLFAVCAAALRQAWRAASWRPWPVELLMVQAIAISFALHLFYGWSLKIHQSKLMWVLLGLTVVVRRLTSVKAL